MTPGRPVFIAPMLGAGRKIEPHPATAYETPMQSCVVNPEYVLEKIEYSRLASQVKKLKAEAEKQTRGLRELAEKCGHERAEWTEILVKKDAEISALKQEGAKVERLTRQLDDVSEDRRRLLVNMSEVVKERNATIEELAELHRKSTIVFHIDPSLEVEVDRLKSRVDSLEGEREALRKMNADLTAKLAESQKQVTGEKASKELEELRAEIKPLRERNTALDEHYMHEHRRLCALYMVHYEKDIIKALDDRANAHDELVMAVYHATSMLPENERLTYEERLATEDLQLQSLRKRLKPCVEACRYRVKLLADQFGLGAAKILAALGM